MTPEGVKYLPWDETKMSNFRKPDKLYAIRDSEKSMHFTGILRDTLKEEACVVPTTFSDFKKVDHKPGKLGLSEVSLIGYHVPYCVWDYSSFILICGAGEY